MNILLINPSYQTITSNWGVGHQVPLGLLMIGGALSDSGHRVRLLDAECRKLRLPAILREVARHKPDVIMTGHAGSTPAHPVTIKMLKPIKSEFPDIKTVYGGVYPSYHATQVLAQEPAVDFVIRGEGEAAAVDLIASLETDPTGRTAASLPGICGRNNGRIAAPIPRPPIHDLDAYRIGRELIENWDDYRCFGLGRAAIIQFSRGCPHKCTYCGQHEFWIKWRYRDPIKVADEIEWLRRTHNVRFITLADENPTTLRQPWHLLLSELAQRKLGVHFFATMRATDIVRDTDVLPLYRQAGILYILMGIESTSDQVLRDIHKNSTTRHDYQACKLLKENGIFSVIGHIIGVADETPARFRATMKQLAHYNGDWLNAMYVTPHDWTPFGRTALAQPIVEPNQRHWDYRHQILSQPKMSPLHVFARAKWMELWFHLRPHRLNEILFEPDRLRRQQQFWTLVHAAAVWTMEVIDFASIRIARLVHFPRTSSLTTAGGSPRTRTPRDRNPENPASAVPIRIPLPQR